MTPLIPKPDQLTLHEVIEKHWSRSEVVLQVRDHVLPTHDHVLQNIADGIASLHTATGTFEQIDWSHAKALVNAFYRHEPFDGTLKISVLPALRSETTMWANMFVGARIGLNLYFTSGQTAGLKPHFDDHHVFAVQLEGSKQWHVGPQVMVATPEAPSYYPNKDLGYKSQLRLRAGEALYLPSGRWHSAVTDHRSLHATIGVYPPTYAAFVRCLISRRCEDDAILRAELRPCICSPVDGRVTFARPSRATILDLTSRLARSSHEHQSGAGRDLDLYDDTSSEDPLLALMDQLWRHAEISGASPISLYIRGSTARWLSGDAINDPWDIDVVLVTRRELSPFGEALAAQNPPLDLLCVTVSELSADHRLLPTRLLLQTEGALIRGVDLAASLPVVDITDDLARIVGHRQVGACRYNLELLAEDATDVLDVRRSAKAALRLACPSMMAALGRFERSPTICAWHLAARFPVIAADVSLLHATLGAIDVADRVAVRDSIVRVLEVVAEESVWKA